MNLSIEGIEIVETTPIQGIVHCDPSFRHASKQNPSAIRLCSQRDGVGCEARDWKKIWKIWEFKIPHLNLQDHITQVLRSSSWKVTPVRQEDNGLQQIWFIATHISEMLAFTTQNAQKHCTLSFRLSNEKHAAAIATEPWQRSTGVGAGAVEHEEPQTDPSEGALFTRLNWKKLAGFNVRPSAAERSASEVPSSIAAQCVGHCAVLGGPANRDAPHQNFWWKDLQSYIQ